MTAAEAERCFSTLQTNKTFLRNSMITGRLSALAMLSIEKKIISHIPDFNRLFIEEFADSKQRRTELIY